MDQELYWLWMSNIKGIGKKKIQVIIEYFDTLEKAFNCSNSEIKQMVEKNTVFKKGDCEAILSSRNADKIMENARRLKSMGVSFVSNENSAYPHQLKHIFDPPSIIYYKGSLPQQDELQIAIVGARKCSPYGKKISEYFGEGLAKNNIVVVSGMARGIDSSAHKGALKAKGRTTAVLGCGVDICYPSENYRLMDEIQQTGCVISEFPLGTPPNPGNFPLRNRIISGLCDGVLIVEAAMKSGSLITADSALEQGKDVFAIPGRILEVASEGNNNLIKMGAKPVTCIDDILEEYMDLKLKVSKNIPKKQLMLDKSEQIVYSCISLVPIFIDQLIENTELEIDELQFVLIKLELKGLVEQLSNQTYIHTI